MDKVGRRLFEGTLTAPRIDFPLLQNRSLNQPIILPIGTSMIGQAQALMKMMTFIITAIDNPVKLIIPLKKLGPFHFSHLSFLIAD